MAFTIQGKGVGDNIIIGKAWVLPYLSRLDVKFKSVSPEKIGSELLRFNKAVKLLKNELKKLSSDIEKEIDREFRNLLDSYHLILDDHVLINGTREKILEKNCNAEWALVQQSDKIFGEFDKIEDPYFRERKEDVQQLVSRLLKIIMNLNKSTHKVIKKTQNFSDDGGSYQKGWILISKEISISEISYLDRRVTGFATELGSPTSHLAIMARSLEIPAVLGLQKSLSLIKHGEEIILDAECGSIIVNPDKRILDIYKNRKKKKYKLKTELRKLIKIKCLTKNGEKVLLMGNIEQPEETQKAIDQGADGIGLFRSEFLFINKDNMPSEEEQFIAYKKVAVDMNGLPVTIRTLDSGADKTLPYLHDKKEQPNNPALGLRAVRLCLAQTEIFVAQLKAILRASAYGDVKILLPLISGSDEIVACRKIIEHAKDQLKNQKINYDEDIQIGAMIEVPSAAIAISSLLPHLDFVSLGTNDLIQYTLAIDRTNSFVSSLYDPEHPAILKLINSVVTHCKKNDTPVSICGEMAGNAQHTDLLLNLGLRCFSMNCSEILLVKEKILNSKCR